MPSEAPARAELIEDGGASADDGEFFRSFVFRDVEGATHTLRIESPGRQASMAVIVQEIQGTNHVDAVSLYGYPGATLKGAGAPPAAAAVDWSATNLVSLFARERLGGSPVLADPSRRGTVLLHDPSRPRQVRPRLAEQVRATARRGYEVEVVRGPESGPRDRAGFHAAYAQTMDRVEATERYMFSPEYIGGVLMFERSWLVLARSPAYGVAAGAIAAVSDGHLHYFLGGTAHFALDDSPFKCVVAAMLDLADELRLPLNLGGGLAAGDGLERFKRGFANGEAPFMTHEVVCDPVAYAELGAPSKDAGFFPAYRAPG